MVCTRIGLQTPIGTGHRIWTIIKLFPKKPDAYAIANGKQAIFRGGKNTGTVAELSNRFGFLPETAEISVLLQENQDEVGGFLERIAALIRLKIRRILVDSPLPASTPIPISLIRINPVRLSRCPLTS